ncbi:hypothetical protein V6N13_003049 [Hibiscus sabdariffa]
MRPARQNMANFLGCNSLATWLTSTPLTHDCPLAFHYMFDHGKAFVFCPDGLSPSIKKTDGIAIDTNTKALLEQVALVDMLDGILTIGTFGFDPLKPFSDELKHCLASESDHEQGEEERFSNNSGGDDGYDYGDGNYEENPLMFSTFDHGLEDVTMTVHGAAEWSTDDEIRTDLDAIEGHSGKLRIRTTLADLFSEDSDSGMKKKHNSLESNSNSCGKGSVRTKQGLSFAKKLMPQAGEDSHPIKMINQMMKRLLKRKIHPELEGKGNKFNKQCSKKEHEASESVYLLQQSPGQVCMDKREAATIGTLYGKKKCCYSLSFKLAIEDLCC